MRSWRRSSSITFITDIFSFDPYFRSYLEKIVPKSLGGNQCFLQSTSMDLNLLDSKICKYHYDPKFSDEQVWANSADPD